MLRSAVGGPPDRKDLVREIVVVALISLMPISPAAVAEARQAQGRAEVIKAHKATPLSNLDWIALSDLTVVIISMVIVKQSLLPITQLYAGPASTLTAMVLATHLLKRRCSGWQELGFNWPKSWLKTTWLTVVTIVFFYCVHSADGRLRKPFFRRRKLWHALRSY